MTGTRTRTRAATKSPVQLLTKAEILAELSREIAEAGSLTAVARGYDITPQQLSDIVKGNANLSKKAREKLRIRLHEYFSRLSQEPR